MLLIHLPMCCTQAWTGRGISKVIKAHMEKRAFDVPGVQLIRIVVDFDNSPALALHRGRPAAM